ncbi:hypothetical protein JCM19240_2698 [Vibrio maritimus]|uniref:Uncharacterized protein n=1 Tax=Vibrio maritimus TaxID=990268 RepID=A0A090TCZ6_9VIBR|nr:hypothetical protein JCM19240_2698 [Vibrio maritimus]
MLHTILVKGIFTERQLEQGTFQVDKNKDIEHKALILNDIISILH